MNRPTVRLTAILAAIVLGVYVPLAGLGRALAVAVSEPHAANAAARVRR